MTASYPGTAHHQALLERIVQYYADDDRIRSVCLFGSLVRGNWDPFSDLDLDIIVRDTIRIDVMTELQALCTAFQPLGEYPLIILPDEDDAGDVVLSSGAEFSIRYHTLATTKHAVIDSLRVLTGTLDIEAIQTAGLAKRQQPVSVNGHDVDRVLRWGIEVKIRLQRQQFWQAEQLLQFMRQTLIEIFSLSRGYVRAYRAFDAVADETLKTQIGTTFPRYSLESIQAALSNLLDILENQLGALSNGQLQLTDTQREVIAKIRGDRSVFEDAVEIR